MSSRYIKKALVAPSGHLNECWRVTRLEADLEQGIVRLFLTGWKDGQSYVDNKIPIDNRTVILNIADIQTYEMLFMELAGKVLSTTEFLDGTVEETPEPTV